jgi:hypothetical protein
MGGLREMALQLLCMSKAFVSAITDTLLASLKLHHSLFLYLWNSIDGVNAVIKALLATLY